MPIKIKTKNNIPFLQLLNYKLKAGALQYTIFISVLISLLVSAFISLTYLQNHFKDKVSMYKLAVQNANLGFAFALEQEIVYNQEIHFELDQSINSKITIYKTLWGVFDLIKVNSQIKNESFQKLALIGGHNNLNTALYLENKNRPLVLVGKTIIRGNVSLPKSGVKRGNISGHAYHGAQLIYGNINQSSAQLPNFSNINYLKNIKENIYNNDSLEFIHINNDQRLVNSFNMPTKIYRQNTRIDLDYVQFTGNFIIESDTLIRVHKTAVLHDIILVAPKIEIDEDVQGNFQAIASQNITIGANSELSYPSAMILNDKNSSQLGSKKNTNQIVINSNAEIKGIVCYLSDHLKNNYQAQIKIQENARITGEVYCDQNIELKGEVTGSVYTKGFIANQNGSVYQNHIYNGEILVEDLPKQYSGLLFDGLPKQVVKWLY